MSNKFEIGANLGELLDQVATVEVSEPQALQMAVQPVMEQNEPVTEQSEPEQLSTEETRVTAEGAVAVMEPAVEVTPATKPPRLFVKPSRPPITSRKLDLHIVGICVEPESAGLMTADAETTCRGFVMYGPSIAYADGRLPYESFLSKLNMDKLVLRQHFRYDRENGKLYRGSLIPDIAGKHTCDLCKRTYFNLTFGELNERRRAQGVTQGAPYCEVCLPALNSTGKSALKEGARLRWLAEDAKSVGAGDIRARQLYAEYSKCIGRQNNETLNILPRVWAVYPVNATPGDWVPEDTVAQEIEAAEQKQGLTIRPFTMVDRYNVGALLALRMEATRGVDGKPGMAIGLLDTESLITTQSCGYTMQLVHRKRLAALMYQKHGYRRLVNGVKLGRA